MTSMERIFQLAAVAFAGIAAYFLWKGNGDGAFVAGVLGAVSYFLSIRSQVKQRNRLREAENEARYLADAEAEEDVGEPAVPDVSDSRV